MLQITKDMYCDRTYRGAEPKVSVRLGSDYYILKRQRKNWNNVLSEYIGSKFIKNCGVPVQEVALAFEGDELVVLCKDFTDELGKLYEIGSMSSSFDTDVSKHDYFIHDVFYLLGGLKSIDMNSCATGFWHMYVMDAILGNPDRHLGNWGFVKRDGVYSFAPIYDNGASLFPRAESFYVSEDWMQKRIFVFPNSKIMFKARERSSYIEVMQSGIVPTEIVAWAKQLPVENAIADAVSGLPDEIAAFYRTVVSYRYSVIIRGEDFVWKGML